MESSGIRAAAVRAPGEDGPGPASDEEPAEQRQRTSGEHLITDEETRSIAEGFLSEAPWLEDVRWGTCGGGAP